MWGGARGAEPGHTGAPPRQKYPSEIPSSPCPSKSSRTAGACCPGDLLHEPVDRRPRRHVVNVALPSIGRELHADGLRPAVDDRRLHPGAGQPADAVGLDRGPGRPPPDLPGRPGDLHRRLAAVQPGARASAGCGLPHGAGGRRLDAQPGGDVDHHQHLHRTRASGPGPSASGAAWSAFSMAAARWSAASWWTPSAGARSSGSTCRWPRRPGPDLRYVPESRAPRPRRVDPVGQVLVIVLLGVADVRHHRGADARAGPRR